MKKLAAILAVSAIVGTFAAMGSLAAAPAYLWSMDTQDEILDYGDDNTGTAFALTKATVMQGAGAAVLTPTGEAAETKMALDLAGGRLEGYLGNDFLSLNAYIPAGMAVKPNSFFLGMGDVTSDWKWVDGCFSTTQVKDGWNTIEYPLTQAMKDISEDGKYKLYFSFFNAVAGVKTPLKGEFILDGISMSKAGK